MYHNCLLNFFESFLVIHQLPLLALLSPLLRVQEEQVCVCGGGGINVRIRGCIISHL